MELSAMAEASTSSRPQSPSSSPIQTPITLHSSLQDLTPKLRKRRGDGEQGLDASDADDEELEMYTAFPAPPLLESLSQDTHLPTPRTSGQVHTPAPQPFFPPGVGSPESPLTHALSFSLARPVVSLPRMRTRSEETLAAQAMSLQPITPAASPARHGSASSSGRSTVLQSPISEASIRTKADLSQLVLAPSPDIPLSITSNGFQPTSEPIIDLSSPFTERTLQLEAGDTTMDEASDSEVLGTDRPGIISMVPIVDENGRAVLVAEDPTQIVELLRPAGGVLERLRTEATTREVARQAELEIRRPDYLKRVAKEDAFPIVEKELVDQGLAIAETPARGRRLQLFDFQATSAESFEQSLMTNGYGTYGEPRTPLRPLVVPDGLGQEALAWLAYSTPLPSGGAFIPFETPGGRPTEKEMKKRKRLEAFQSSTARACAKLYTGQVEGLGRVLLNVPPEDAAEVFGTPAKKRNVGRKKRATPVASEKRIKQEEVQRDNVSTQRLWLDSEKPWAARREEREGEMRAQEENRMMWIEQYLSHDTDSDERHESDDDDDDFPMSWDEFSSKPPVVALPRPGRGKSVPLKTDPATISGPRPMEDATVVSPVPQHTRFASDPADARSAFLGKRAVRAIALRKHRQQSANRDNQNMLGCECGTDGEDKQAVLCDDCNMWYHLECINIRDEAELGGSEEPWFCPRCVAEIQAGVEQSMMQHREPNFFVADQSPVRKNARSDVSLYSSSSPLQSWGSSGSFRTPLRGSSHRKSASKSHRSIWDDTPRGSASKGTRITTPGTGMSAFTHHAYQYGSPSLSASRNSTFATPKNPSTGVVPGFDTPGFGVPWAINTGSVHTPRGNGNAASNNRSRYPNIGSTGFGFPSEDSGGVFGQGVMHAYAWRGDRDENDTPISRQPPSSSTLGPLPFNALNESPLAQKGQGLSQTLMSASGSRSVPSLQSPASPLAHVSRRS